MGEHVRNTECKIMLQNNISVNYVSRGFLFRYKKYYADVSADLCICG